jgi:hypothetical protein
VQKLRAKDIEEKKEAEHDMWFKKEHPMLALKKTWKKKRIEREDRNNSLDSNGEAATGEHGMKVDVNMVFQLPAEFGLPATKTAQLDLGVERAVFQKPDKLGQHMKPLDIRGYLDREPVNRMLVDGGAFVNVMPCSLFEKLGHKEGELMRKNMTLNGFSGETSDARGIISMELTIGNKTLPTTFFVVGVKGKYNVLLGRDWIHANGCVYSTLHQCVVQWVGNEVEIIKADDSACVALTESQGDLQEGEVRCLMGRDLSDYDYVSVSTSGFVPVSVKPMVVNQLKDIGVKK